MKKTEDVYQILEKSFDEVYNKRLKHRENCKKWKKKHHCIECGFGLDKFKKDVLKIFMQKKIRLMISEESKQTIYIDKFGRKWEKTSIDQIFEALTQKKKIDNVLDYYAFKEE